MTQGTVNTWGFTFTGVPVLAGDSLTIEADAYCSFCAHWYPNPINLTVNSSNTQVTYTGDLQGHSGHSANLSAVLVDTTTNLPLANKIIHFTLDSLPEVTGVTDASGIATAIINLPDIMPGGVYALESRFMTDSSYFGSFDMDNFTVIQNDPPVAEAGPEPEAALEQTSLQGVSITLDGSGSTDDGNNQPLTYTWTWAGGSVTGINPTVVLPLGITVITLTVNDGEYTATDTVTYEVQDTTAPTIITNLPGNITVEQATLQGTVVDISAFASDICDSDVPVTHNAPAIFPLGTTIVTFTATDDSGNTATEAVPVTVVDSTAPGINVDQLGSVWPPNHKLVEVATYTVTDTCDSAPATMVSVTHNENPHNNIGTGDGNTNQDWLIEPGAIWVMAERDGTGTGRIYTITITSQDLSGNVSTSTFTVLIPHNQ